MCSCDGKNDETFFYLYLLIYFLFIYYLNKNLFNMQLCLKYNHGHHNGYFFEIFLTIRVTLEVIKFY